MLGPLLSFTPIRATRSRERTAPPSTLREDGEGPRKFVKFWPDKRARLTPSTLKPNKGV